MTYAHGHATLARIMFSEDDRYRGEHLYEILIELALRMNLGGATVLRGVEGFGAAKMVHSARISRSAEDIPIIIEVVDTRARVEPYLDRVESIFEESHCGGLITLENTEVIYRKKQPA